MAAPTSYLTDEDGNYILTEGGFRIIVEGGQFIIDTDIATKPVNCVMADQIRMRPDFHEHQLMPGQGGFVSKVRSAGSRRLSGPAPSFTVKTGPLR